MNHIHELIDGIIQMAADDGASDRECYSADLIAVRNQLTDHYAALAQRLAAAEKELAAAREALQAAEADAERYRALRTVTPYRFKKLQDSCIADTGDTLYFLDSRFNNAVDELQRINNIRSAIGGTPEIAEMYRRKCVQFVQNETACVWPNCTCDHPGDWKHAIDEQVEYLEHLASYFRGIGDNIHPEGIAATIANVRLLADAAIATLQRGRQP